MTTTAKAPTSYGPIQFLNRTELTTWQFERAQRLGLVPAPDQPRDRWSPAAVDDALARIDAIRKATGTMPDIGAARAEEYLAEHFNLTLNPGTALELFRRGHLPRRGHFKGHPLYCGLTLESFKARDRGKIERASAAGKLHMRDAAATALGIREADLNHLIRAGLLTHSAAAEGWFKSEVLLYRQGDLDRLARSSRIDWEAVRNTPKGRRSPLAALPTRRLAACQ
ncbi:hypothetical protein OG345_42270 (plasmid) [Streptomyces sp. NBC_01220]|uniref:hypothetical protein n=1 Tax=Streptomyces sp. NBC_01220 TaxID=2903781 RepID=UPI00352CFBB5|nr:hypothetical protein OG345_42270 [Streptomyces sp. NBC_01220]